MNYQEKVQYLKSYRDMYYRLEYINGQIEKIRSPHLGELLGPSKTLNDYLDEKDLLVEKMAVIEDLVAKIEDYKQMVVLKYKFLEFKTLEEVAMKMNYSLSQVKRYYSEGIGSLMTK